MGSSSTPPKTYFSLHRPRGLAEVDPTPAAALSISLTVVEWIEVWTLRLASIIEAGAAVVIALAALMAIFRSLALMFWPRRPQQDKEIQIRLRLGRWLSVALEFEVAADILRTAVAPTWNDIGQLAAIITLRTALNFFCGAKSSRSRCGPARRQPPPVREPEQRAA